MDDGARVFVYAKVRQSCPTFPLYYWFRVGTLEEKKRGHHIVIEDILDEKELNERLTRGEYVRRPDKSKEDGYAFQRLYGRGSHFYSFNVAGYRRRKEGAAHAMPALSYAH